MRAIDAKACPEPEPVAKILLIEFLRKGEIQAMISAMTNSIATIHDGLDEPMRRRAARFYNQDGLATIGGRFFCLNRL
jgi:hypothetical protein